MRTVADSVVKSRAAASEALASADPASAAAASTPGRGRGTPKPPKPLGEGRYSVVWEAEHKGKLLALKVWKQGQLSPPDFWREVNILRDLQCKYVVQYCGHLLENNQAILFMRSCPRALTDLMAQRKLKDNGICVKHIAKALRYMHKRGIVHQDLKPENCLLSESNHIVLCDFGQAARTGESCDACGTVTWAAPENCKPHLAQPSSDIFSFGLLMWFVFTATGEAPCTVAPRFLSFSTKSCYEDGSRPKPQQRWDPEWRKLMQACWHRDADQRPSASRVLRLIRKCPEAPES
eukprot:TRINITY_DN12123_c0_g1_i3.p1 TRINITY_DN12123_c0_g1~~TRINITY_DN12123_c0_g1_i3.p1  ORF type:complete len:340 (-),score=47.11 TRINITY_DN12123_c0_g1_i3:51-926(-)